ncbi:hypothetical protein BV898_16248 [Hypsibius exemplaris]|uniref:Uncharacterized protein n=1 Tax=Hypsibius exemplaris TaxID=2072580 RepID=A0A9X6NCZ2_HYPEX|nr:hypothetical protein BV898_16248 [Hypsibius exemplaris]
MINLISTTLCAFAILTPSVSANFTATSPGITNESAQSPGFNVSSPFQNSDQTMFQNISGTRNGSFNETTSNNINDSADDLFGNSSETSGNDFNEAANNNTIKLADDNFTKDGAGGALGDWLWHFRRTCGLDSGMLAFETMVWTTQ